MLVFYSSPERGDSIDLQSAREELVMAEEDGKDRYGISEDRNNLPQLGRLEEKQEEAAKEEKKISAIL